MPIQILDDATIGKIAAGEVIERPASVVKELVENALDAHARSILIEIEAGGKDLIRIRDDGDGIQRDDLLLAVQRHSTSKLKRFEDLDHLASFGFRGEALSSIAAVADLQILSRMPNERSGWLLRSEFGRNAAPSPVATAGGTTISVKDLFANVPARRKFLKQDATEVGYIQRVVAAYALGFPEVRFELSVDGSAVLLTSGSGDLLDAAVGVFGAEIAGQMVPIEPPEDLLDEDQPEDRREIAVTGLIGLPTVTRGNRQQMVLLMNRRWIEHRSLAFAIEQSYHTLIMVGRYPIAVINISVPPERVDVNVHPTKREVRFSDERLIFSSVQRAVRGTLMRHTPAQSIPLVVESPLSAESVQRRMTLANPERAKTPPRAMIEPPTSSSPSERVLPPDPIEPDVPILRVLGQVGATYIIAEGSRRHVSGRPTCRARAHPAREVAHAVRAPCAGSPAHARTAGGRPDAGADDGGHRRGGRPPAARLRDRVVWRIVGRAPGDTGHHDASRSITDLAVDPRRDLARRQRALALRIGRDEHRLPLCHSSRTESLARRDARTPDSTRRLHGSSGLRPRAPNHPPPEPGRT